MEGVPLTVGVMSRPRAGVPSLAAMTIASRVPARFLELPPADTYDVTVTQDLEVPMPDGIKLLADHYAPRGGGKRPTLLVRSPYGRRAFFGLQFGRLSAERGFRVPHS